MNKKFYLILGIFISFQLHSFSQTTIEVTGTVKSAQGGVQGAQIDFLEQKDDFISNSITGPSGRFKSDAKIAVGKSIKVRVSKYGFETLVKLVKVDKTGEVGEFMLKAKRLAISGIVKDSMTDKALDAVEVYFYEDSKLIQTKSTNSLGYFDIETAFNYGQKITVRVFKSGYYDKEQTLSFTSDGMNRLQDIMLPELSARGLRAFIRLKDKKSGKTLGGAMVHYLDKKKSSYIDAAVPANGELELKLFQPPGTSLDFEISKPNFRTIKARPTLSQDPLNNVFTYELEKDKRSALGPVLLTGAIVSALAAGGSYLSYDKSYKSYKEFKNIGREDDYDKAQKSLNITSVASTVAVGALIGFVIVKIADKNRIKALERKQIKLSQGGGQFSNSQPVTARNSLGISIQL